MKIKLVLEKYLEHKKLYSARGTYHFYYSHIRVLINYFNQINIFNVKDINSKVIDYFIEYKINNGNSNNTINKEIGILKRAFLHSNIYIKGVTDQKPLRFKRKSYQVLNDKELSVLINHVKSYNKNIQLKLSNYLVFFVILYTGVRRTELVNITINEVDLDNCCIYLNHTKSGAPRLVFFKEHLVTDIKKYIDINPNRKYLFHNVRNNKRMTPENVTAYFRYLQKTTQINKISSHVLRHTMATVLVENDAPIAAIQRLLGHSSSKTTDIYLHMSVKKLKKSFDQHFPSL